MNHISGRKFSHECLLVLMACFVFSAYSEEKKNSNHFQGTATCSSSNCHGGVNPKIGTDVLMNEYSTWYRYDKHAGAYKTLLNPQAKRIAKNLGIPAAEKSAVCLDCHATFSRHNTANAASKYRVEDGVSCESCHGAAAEWLKIHSERGNSHEKNIAAGLTDLQSATDKAKVCTSCHLGDNQREITHKIYGAGHPRLIFELDTFIAMMPNHWRKKNSYDGVNAWLAGLAVQGVARLSNLNAKNFSHWLPEFSNFSCTACHHSLKKKEFENREYLGRPGELKLNLASLSVLAEVLAIFENSKSLAMEGNKLRDSLKLLNNTMDRDQIINLAGKTSDHLSKYLIPQFSGIVADKQLKYRIFDRLADFNNPSVDYETLEQAAIGMSVISSSEGNPAELKSKVDKLYKLLSNNELP